MPAVSSYLLRTKGQVPETLEQKFNLLMECFSDCLGSIFQCVDSGGGELDLHRLRLLIFLAAARCFSVSSMWAAMSRAESKGPWNGPF